jgi:hypothetical protein
MPTLQAVHEAQMLFGAARGAVGARYIALLSDRELLERVEHWLARAVTCERHYVEALTRPQYPGCAPRWAQERDLALAAALFWDDCLAGRRLLGCGYCGSGRGLDVAGRCLACGGL